MEESTRRSAGRPEKRLAVILQNFQEDLIANLGSSNFHKKHSAGTYKHYQHRGFPKDGDDFHSPVHPTRYIELRMKKAIRFYKVRIPKYNRCKNCLRMIVVLLSVAASALARHSLAGVVVLVTAASAAVTSWLEFTDMASKAERYNHTIGKLNNLLHWWASLTEVQKASRELIATLIMSSEAAITSEQTGWNSIMSKTGPVSRASDGEEHGLSAGEKSSSHGGNSGGDRRDGGGPRVMPVSSSQ